MDFISAEIVDMDMMNFATSLHWPIRWIQIVDAKTNEPQLPSLEYGAILAWDTREVLVVDDLTRRFQDRKAVIHMHKRPLIHANCQQNWIFVA
jgi:hypothetical protein